MSEHKELYRKYEEAKKKGVAPIIHVRDRDGGIYVKSNELAQTERFRQQLKQLKKIAEHANS